MTTRSNPRSIDEPLYSDLGLVAKPIEEQRWADRAGPGWLAVEALDKRAPRLARDWPLVVIDGFDNFTPVQLDFLRVLADRVDEMIISGLREGCNHSRLSPSLGSFRVVI